jgi:hypothetical protein
MHRFRIMAVYVVVVAAALAYAIAEAAILRAAAAR